jgi:hypothetical protein
MNDTIEMRRGVSNMGCVHLTLSQHRGEQRGKVLLIRRLRQDDKEIEFGQ